MVFATIMGLFEAVWRRCFGSDGWNLPVLSSRTVQHIIGLAVVGPALYFKGYPIWLCVIAAATLQFLLWSPGHGPAFDMGRVEPDEKMLKRYDKVWYNSTVQHLVPKEDWYTRIYDFFWMLFRYGTPGFLLAAMLNNPEVFFACLFVPVVYEVCYRTTMKTELAEYVIGFLIGFGMFI